MRNFGRQAQLTSVLQEGLWRTALRVPSAPARLSNGCRCRRQDLTKVEDDAWQGVLRAEIDGMFHTIRAALPGMRRRRWGRIVNIGMERSEEFTEPPYDYTVGKIARHGLTRILSEVEIGRGITINAVAPGYVPYFTFHQALEAVRHRGPWASRRHGTPQDVAEVIAFLSLDEGRNVTGAVIPVHGAPD